MATEPTIEDLIEKEIESVKAVSLPRPRPNTENWQDLLESFKIQHNKVYEQPPVCLSLKNKLGDESYFATLGNFSAIIGKAKSRKTFSISLLLAAALRKETSNQFISAHLPKGKRRIVLFDTEQSEYDVSKVSHRIRMLAEDLAPDNLEVYSLRSLNPADRLFMIEQFIYSSGDLGILVIDGIRDLIKDINSPEEATEISSRLLKWTQERHIHIITVIHQNKGDNNARGHVGTEIINKAESVISVEKDNEISIVRPEFVRGKDFEPFAFSVDVEGKPYILEDWSESRDKATPKAKVTAQDVPKETHLKALREVFKVAETKKYKELQSTLKVVFQSFSMRLTDSQVVDFISYYRLQQFVVDTGTRGKLGNQYSFNHAIAL